MGRTVIWQKEMGAVGRPRLWTSTTTTTLCQQSVMSLGLGLPAGQQLRHDAQATHSGFCQRYRA